MDPQEFGGGGVESEAIYKIFHFTITLEKLSHTYNSSIPLIATTLIHTQMPVCAV